MHDSFPAFHSPDRPRRRVVALPLPGSEAAIRARPAMRPGALAVQAAAQHAQAWARGNIACRGAWRQLQALGPDGVRALPRASMIRHIDVDVIPSLAALAADVAHTLANGASAGSARALVLLAALAEARFEGGEAARAIAFAAVTLAAAHGQTWVAALAWELAAALCQQYTFGAALPAYRRRALMAWRACGANGRIAQLCRGWSQDGAGGHEAAQPGLQAGRRVSPQCDARDGDRRQDLPDPDELRRVARASMVGELGVSIAHEVNQPLAAILLQAAGCCCAALAAPSHARPRQGA